MATTKVYTVKIDGLDASGQKVGELRQELVELTGQLETVGAGSQAATAILKRMGEVRGELKGLRDEVKALDPEQQITAFNNFAQGVVGAFGIATAAAETLGLSNTAADEYVKKTQAIITVLSSLEAVRNALDGETLNAIKTTFANIRANVALGESFTLAGAKAKLASITTRQALLATGIGAVVVLVGLLISNWDRVTTAVNRNKDTVVKWLGFLSPPLALTIKALDYIEKKFGSLGAFVSGAIEAIKTNLSELGQVVGDLLSGDPKAAFERAKNLGNATAQGFHRGVVEKQVELSLERSRLAAKTEAEELARQVAVAEAGGQKTYFLKLKQLTAELTALETNTEEELKVYKDKYNEILVLQAANNKKLAEDAEKAEKDAADAREKARKEAEAKEKERLARLKEARAAERAALEQNQAFEERLLSIAGKDTLELRIKQAEARLAQDKERSAEEKALLQKDLDDLLLLQAEYTAREAKLDEEARQARKEARQDAQAEELDDRTRFNAGVLQGASEVREKALALAKRPFNIGTTILEKIFGINPEDVERIKESLAESFATIQSSVQDIATAFLEGSIADADTRLSEAQTRLQALDQQLNEQAKASENTAKQLDDAKGARRDFLIQKLAKERAEEEKTRAARAAAAKEEQAALKEKARLEQQAQRINAASIGIQTLLQAIEAGRAIAAAAKAGKFGVDNIAYTIAQTAALVSGFLAVKNAVKMEQGGLLRGPRHSAGGIPVGTTGIEVEGGEFVVNRWATAKFLPLLESINDVGRMRVLPSPSLRPKMEQGGLLPGALPAGAASAESVRSLEAKMDRNNVLLEMILSTTSTTATTNQQLVAYGPPQLAIGPEQALAIEEQKQQAQKVQELGTL